MTPVQMSNEFTFCDACGPAVKARYAVSLSNGGFLTYCIHHANRYKAALLEQGALIIATDAD